MFSFWQANSSFLGVNMTLSSVTAALDRATVEVPNVDDLPARFMLYPLAGQDPGALASQVAAELLAYQAGTVVNAETERAIVILTLSSRIMLNTAAPFDAAYEMVRHWDLKSAEPELLTDFFPDNDTLPGDKGTDEGMRDLCWAPVDPAIDGKPQWALDMLRVPQAWEWSRLQGRPAMGKGVIVAQPDTGVTDHPDLQGVPQVGAVDLFDGAKKAIDSLDYLGNTSHGTGTGSVLLSRPSAKVTGAAPAATHMPIRAIHNVVRVSQLRVAQAINHAVDSGAHVISMSLGGLPSLFLWLALRRAIENNLIVLAAAGNCVRTVVWPARYDDCIAVAGVNIEQRPWRGSCRGGAVAVSAPGENVIKALAVKNGSAITYDTEQGQGTSFAVAMTAGVAALWLAHHGRDAVVEAATAQGVTVQALFKRLLTATARKPDAAWDEANMGAGIVNAEALLKAPLAQGAGQEEAQTEAPAADSIRNLLDEAAADSDLDEDTLDLYGMELANVALEARRCCENGETGDEGAPVQASERIRQAIPATTLERLALVRS
jgi:hypothetical protein